MEMQQMFEWLMAGQAEMFARLEENMDSNQVKATKQEEILAELNAKMDATIRSNQSKVQETIHNRVENIRAELNQKTEAVLERQRVRNEETAIHSLKACRSETMECQETTEARLEYEEAASGDIKDDRNETTACNEATEKIEPGPGMMHSATEHQDIPSEDITVMPVKGLRKQRRFVIWPQTAARRGRMEPGEIVDLRESQMPPAGRCAVM
jgi:hypothetical protein